MTRGILGTGRLVGAGPVLVMNVSRHGVALRGLHRGLPGRAVALHWTTGDDHLRLAARIVRSRVAALRGEAGVEYAMGLEFTEPSGRVWELATRNG